MQLRILVVEVDQEFPVYVLLGRKQGLAEKDSVQTSLKRGVMWLSARGPQATEFAQSKLGSFRFHKEYRHSVGAPYNTSFMPPCLS